MSIGRMEVYLQQAESLHSRLRALKEDSGGLYDYLDEAEMHAQLCIEQLRGAIRFAEEVEADEI